MRSLRHAWERICSFENLLHAYDRARKGKRNRIAVQRFELERERNLLALQASLLDGSTTQTAGPDPQPSPPPTDASSDPRHDEGPTESGSFPWRTVTIGAGAGVLALGAVAVGVAYSKKGSVDEMCDGKSCYPEAKDDYDTANNWANGATVVTVAGTALLVTGLFFLSDEEEPDSSPNLAVGAGPGGASIRGSWRF
jgi:hypothetical protein